MQSYIVSLLLALVVVVTAHNHEEHDYQVKSHDDLLKFRDHCAKTLSISDDLIEKYKTWQYPDDEKTHCYMKCIFEQFGFFDEKNGFDVAKIHHQLAGPDVHVNHNDETHQKIEQCADKNTQGSDACTWAYRGGMCFIKEHLQLVQGSVKKD